MSINRSMANLIDGSGSLADGGGVTVYATKENLPTTGLTSGDQAYVSNTSRLYISNGSGWYNVALINATPSLTIDPTGAIALAKDGSTPTTITLTATDSDNAVAGLSFSVDSDGNFAGLGTLSQDSSVFTITPLSEDSATTTTSTLTFKASDGISFGSGQRTLSLTFAAANSKYTTLLSKADTAGTDNQVDAGPTAHALTESGPITSTAFSPYHPGGYSVYFDGNDYISVADGTYKTLGSDPWTYECWVYPTSVAAGNKWILGDHASSGSGSTTSVNLVMNGANFGIFCRTSAASNISVNESTTRSVNQWYHLALVFDQSNVILYVDGTAVITQAHTGGFNDGSGSFSVGRTGDYNGAYYTGYVRDVRLVKGTAVYTTTFTPPTDPLTAISGTEILLCHLPYIADGSTNGNAVTVGGNTTTKRVGPYDYLGYAKADHGGSVYFDDAANTYMVTGPTNHADFGFGTGDWTVEMWIWVPSGYTQANNYIVDIGANGLIFRIVNNKFTYTNSTLGFSGNLYTTGAVFTNDSWHHMAVCRISGTVKMYMNGKETASETDTHNSSSTKVWFGRYGGSTSYQYTGYVCDVRIVKGTGVYTSNFTPPTEPLTAITNTVLLTCTNKNDIWDAGAGNKLSKVGNATSSNTQRKFTTSSAMYFDGTGDYLSTGSNDLLAMGTGDFTVECWVYKSDTNHRGIWQIGSAVGGIDVNYTTTLGFVWRNSPSEWQIYAGGTNVDGSSSFALSTNTWYHAAVVRSSGTTKLYINGTEEISTSDTQNYTGTYMAIGGAYTTSYLHNGYIQDVRVTKGFARYTSNFTPPTAEFAG
jgi:hypothetical protein